MLEKKIKGMKAVASIFLIALTLLMPVTFTALQPEIDLVRGEIKQNSVIDSFASVLSKVIEFFDIVPSVSAQDVGCCKVMKNGAKCQSALVTECDVTQGFYANKSCTDTNPSTGLPYCQIGCCITGDGMCMLETISTDCLVPPALKFVRDDARCQQDLLCRLGCCSVGYERYWMTNKTCVETKGGSWDGGVSYESCFTNIDPRTMGCCRYECKFESVRECANKMGRDVGQVVGEGLWIPRKCYENVPGCTQCVQQASAKCVEGFPDLYWADSCGNAYVDEVNTFCSRRNEICNASTNKCDSGKCTNVFDNFKANGDFTALPGRHGQTRESGESWCVYDRPDLVWGNGTEPAGSRHWRCSCIQGKEYCEPCADYRQQICVESLFDITQGKIIEASYHQRYSNNYRSFASCIGNPWRTCLLLKDEDDCNSNPSCFWITDFAPLIGKVPDDIFRIEDGKEKGFAGVRADTLEETDSGDPELGTIVGPPRCLPRIPPGLDVGFNHFQNKETICKLVSYACTVEDRLLGGDKNPECNDIVWMELMAHRCRAIADCGVWFNYLHAPSSNKNTATQDGILIAEVTPEYDAEGNVTEKEIERNFKLLDNNNFEKYQQIIADPFKIFEMNKEKWGEGGWGWALILDVLTYFGIALPHKSWLLTMFKANEFKFSFWGGKGLLNAYTVIGAILLIIAAIIPGPQWLKESVRSVGYGLTAKGIATGLGAGAGVSLAIGAAALLTYALFFAVWDVDHMVVECYPWMPPAGGDDCEKCDDDPMRPCSKYRCESLGTACVWNGTTADGLPCEQSPESECGVCHKEHNDGAPPVITKVSVKEAGYSVSPQQPGMPPSTIVVSKGGSPIEPNSVFTLQLDFNERAVCKWHTQHTLSFNEMPPAWFGSNTWKYNQTMSIPVGKLIEGYNIIYIYVRCADSYMNANIGEYTIQFAVTTTDMAPPIILGTDRDYNKNFGYGVTELPLWIYVNEMAKCRWAKQDIDYSLMGGECSTILSQTGFKCNTTLTGLQSEPPGLANPFYIRCNDTSGNVMQQSYQLTLYPTLPLKIINIVPENGAYVKGCEISGIELEVETSEGADNGKAICYWKNQSMIDFTKFTETNAVSHRTNVSATSQTINITCYDSALNKATNSTTFTVEADQTPPVITRIYKDSGNLVLRTNEDATCSYNFRAQSCNFEANDTLIAKPFSGAGSMEHRVDWTTGPWYLKCYDTCGNGYESWRDCTAVIKPQDVE